MKSNGEELRSQEEVLKTTGSKKPFIGNEPRFAYQKAKIKNDRDSPTGDFGVHMGSIKDRDVFKKRQAMLESLNYQNSVLKNQQNAVFTSSVERR
jgi:hypothetical protein